MYFFSWCFVLLLSAMQCYAMESAQDSKDAIKVACQEYRSRVLQEVFRDIFDWRSLPTYNPNDRGHVALYYTSEIKGEDAQHVRIYRPKNNSTAITIEEYFLNKSLKEQIIDSRTIRRRLLELYKECSWPAEHNVSIAVKLNSVGDVSEVTLRTAWKREELVQERDNVCKNMRLMQSVFSNPIDNGGKNRKILLPSGFHKNLSYLNKILGDEQQEHKKS